MTWQHGKHNSKAGVEFVRYQQNNFYPGNDGALGGFTYNGDFTTNPNVGSLGYSVADFVLDRVEFEGIGSVAGRTGQRQWRSAYFVQDDWHVLPKLTLNLGVRYEFDQPIYEVNNKQASVNFATGQAILAGVDGNSRALYNPTHNNVMPRIGFAYQANDRFVVRGGYGITTFLEGTGANLRMTYNPPLPAFSGNHRIRAYHYVTRHFLQSGKRLQCGQCAKLQWYDLPCLRIQTSSLLLSQPTACLRSIRSITSPRLQWRMSASRERI